MPFRAPSISRRWLRSNMHAPPYNAVALADDAGAFVVGDGTETAVDRVVVDYVIAHRSSRGARIDPHCRFCVLVRAVPCIPSQIEMSGRLLLHPPGEAQ